MSDVNAGRSRPQNRRKSQGTTQRGRDDGCLKTKLPQIILHQVTDNYMTNLQTRTCRMQQYNSQLAKTYAFRPHSRAAQVTESALVALATRAGVALISELASVHSGGFGKGGASKGLDYGKRARSSGSAC